MVRPRRPPDRLDRGPRPVVAVALVMALLAWPERPAAAQTVASTTLSLAEVVLPLAIQGERDLDFGSVLPGFPETVDPFDATAGKFRVVGVPGREVLLVADAPGRLNKVNGGGNMSVSFTGALTNEELEFNPEVIEVSGSTVIYTFPQSGQFFIWVGGTVFPSSNQKLGAYAATLTVTVTYTGS